MDLLSRLLALMPVAGSLDDRCHFGAPWRIDHAPSAAREIAWHILLRGEAIVEDESGPPVTMHAGDVVLFPSGGAHQLHDGSGAKPKRARHVEGPGFAIVTNDAKGAGADVLCGRFLLPAVPQRLLRDHLPGRLLVRHGPEGHDDASLATSRLVRLIGLMREEAAEAQSGCEAVVNHLSGALFGLTLRRASESGDAPQGLLALTARPRLQPAIDAMFESPEKAWTLPALAELCNMSRATFARQFDEAIGRSASDMLLDIRMAIAGRKLAQTAASVAQIGEDVGYQSDAAFQRVFKKHVGVTPAQWRTQSRADTGAETDTDSEG